MAQPVSGTAKAGEAGGEQQGAQGDKAEEGAGMEEFLTTSRTGRRNAVPDIGDEKAGGGSASDLPLEMAKLSCAEGGTADPAGEASQPSKQASNQTS